MVNKLIYKSLPQTLFFYFKNFGIKDFRFNFVRPEGRAFDNFGLLVPTYSEILPYLKESFLMSKKLDLDISSEGIPFCILKGIKNFKRLIGEFRDGKGKIKEGVDFRKEFRFANVRKEKLRLKAETCKKCIYDSLCEGPWKNYVKIYGFKEFKPVKLA